MKKKIILTSLAIAVAGASLFGLAASTLAADTQTAATGNVGSTQTGNMKNWLAKEHKLGGKQIGRKNVAMNKNRAAVQAALQANDYQAWLKAVGANSAIAKKVTSDNFPKLVQAYNLRLQAENLMEEIGLGKDMSFSSQLPAASN